VRISSYRIPVLPPPSEGPVRARDGKGFAEVLSEAWREVGRLQAVADEATVRLVSGEVEHLHDVVIAAEKASLAFELVLSLRNRVLEAYQEIMRMQV